MSRHSPGGSSSNNNDNDDDPSSTSAQPKPSNFKKEFRVPSRAHRRALHRRRKAVPTTPSSSAAHSQEDDLEDSTGHRMSLVRSPRARAVSPYEPFSEGEDQQLKFLTHHCGFYSVHLDTVSSRSCTRMLFSCWSCGNLVSHANGLL